MRDPSKLIVWHRALDYSVAVSAAIPLSASRKAPGLRRQVIRAACAISEAISEGCGKRTEREFARYLDIACGSATEVQGQLALALRHGIIDRRQAARLWREAGEIRRMLTALARKVRERADEQGRRNGDGEAPGPRT
jgi:four helix bundle protein